MHNDLPFNFVRLLGNLVQDPDVKVSGQTTIAHFSIAVQSGKEEKKKTNWFPCVAFGELAEQIEQELKKGSRIILEGKLSEDKWKTQDGENRKRTEVIVFEYEIQQRQEGKRKVPDKQTDEDII